MRFRKITAIASAIALLGSLFTAIPASAALPAGDFVLAAASESYAAPIYVDSDGSDYDGLSLIADAFAGDVELVSGQKPDVVTDTTSLSGKIPVIAGVIGEHDGGLIDSLIKNNKVDASEIQDKWETYKIQLVENPTTGVEKALVIIGSDKRGAIYGIFHISEMIGVSPWVYYGDVTPEKQNNIVFSKEELNITSKEPSVKYRGIFLNDEQPNLDNWAKNKFGGFNYKFYRTMYEVLLRLKGNYLWPAMWGEEFSKNGVKGLSGDSSGALASAELADKYGVVMGTSHHEPMARAGNEWGQEYKSYLTEEDAAKGSKSTWDYFDYRYAIYNFWHDGYNRNKKFDNVITIGMRGEADSALGGGLKDNIDNLKTVITDQFAIMQGADKISKDNTTATIPAKPAEVPPTMICLYKEVEQYWYGGTENGAEVAGLKDWEEGGNNPLDDTIVMLCDDNFGNLRTVPTAADLESHDKWGMYYHFDYVGGPHTYKWIATNQLEKTWENMTATYEYGIKDLWIVNVGDFKPMELNTSFFLDLAYDYDTYSKVNSTQAYYKTWAAQQFGYGAESELTNAIAQILSDYLKMNGSKKPEKMFPDTFSLTEYNEAQIQLAKANDLYDRAWEYYEKVPATLKDAYYQLVLYPAAASANIERWCIYSGLNSMYAKEGSMLANVYAALVEECYALDISMQEEYNKINGGKWNGMMTRELHIGYNNYNSAYDNANTTYVEPRGEFISPEEDADDTLIVNTDTSTEPVKTSAEISFSNLYKEARALTVSHSRSGKFSYTVSASDNWIQLTKESGTTNTGEVIGVSVDWNNVTATTTGTITISGLDSTVTITVNANVTDVSSIADGAVMPDNGVAAVLAEDYSAISKAGDWIKMENYGREKSSMKAADYTADYTIANAPWLEYKIYAKTAGDYYLTAYTAPTNSRTATGKLPFGLKINDGDAYAVNTIAKRSVYDSTQENYYYLVDDGNSLWKYGCIDNVHVTTTKVTLNAGVNTIRFMSLDSGTVLQKLVVSEGTAISNLNKVNAKLDNGADSEPYYYNDISSELGAVPTYITGSTVTQQSLTAYEAKDKQIVPGTVTSFTEKTAEVIVSEEVPYLITVAGTIDSAAAIEVTLSGETVLGEGASVSVEDREVTVTAEYDSETGSFIAATDDGIPVGAYTLSYTVTGDDNAVIDTIALTANDGMSKIEVLNNAFDSEAKVSAYEAYTGSATLSKSGGGELLAQNFPSPYSSTNGIKTDVTALVKGASGLKFGASADVYSTNSGASKLFLEIVDKDGNKRQVQFATSADYTNNRLSLKGESEDVTFGSSDTVYLCITQYSGYTSFDNIKLWYYAEKVTEELFLDDFSSASQKDSYSAYDAADAPIKSIGGDSNLYVQYNSGWNSKNGIRKNITDYIKDYSGSIFTASADFKTGSFNGNPVHMFFEILGKDGTVSRAGETTADGTNGQITPLKIQTILTFEDTDEVYLCVTHHAGDHTYDNIGLSATYAKLPDPPTTENTTVFKHTFNANKTTEIKMYEPYETDGGTVEGGNGPVLKYTNGSAAAKGVKINITDKLAGLSGKVLGASANVKPGDGSGSWSGSNNVKLFFEVVPKSGEKAAFELATATTSNFSTAARSDSETGGDLGSNWLVTPVTGERELAFEEGDTVYLCITSTNNPMWLDDITVYYVTALGMTVKFDTDGGSAIQQQVILDDSKNKKATKPATDPTKDGYKFAGWYTEKSGGVAFDFDTEITDDTIIYAHWTPKTTLFTHTFDSAVKATQAALYEPYESGGGAVTGGNSEVLKYDQGSTSPAVKGVKINLTEKFSLTADASGKVFGASANIKPSEGAWTDVKLFLEVVPKEGDKTTVELAAADKSTPTTDKWLSEPIAGESKLTFADGDTVYLCITAAKSDATIYYDDITVYYLTSAGYTVTFNTDGGSIVGSQTVTEGEKAIKPETDPIKDGYKFADWYTTADGDTEFDFNSRIAGDTIIYAHWTPIGYAVTKASMTNGDITLSAATANAGDSITVTIAPANGYKLDALTVDGENVTSSVSEGSYTFTMPAKTVEIGATFVRKAVKSITVTGSTPVTKGQTGAYTAAVTAEDDTDVTELYKSDIIWTVTGNTLAGTTISGTDNTAILTLDADETGTDSEGTGYVTVAAAIDSVHGEKAVEVASEQYYNITVASGISGGSIVPGKTSAQEGETVTFTVTADDGYTLTADSIKVNNGAVEFAAAENDNEYSFTMPAGAVEITAAFEAAAPANEYLTLLDAFNSRIKIEKKIADEDNSVELIATAETGETVPAMKVYITVYDNAVLKELKPIVEFDSEGKVTIAKPAVNAGETYKIFIWTDNLEPIIETITANTTGNNKLFD